MAKKKPAPSTLKSASTTAVAAAGEALAMTEAAHPVAAAALVGEAEPVARLVDEAISAVAARGVHVRKGIALRRPETAAAAVPLPVAANAKNAGAHPITMTARPFQAE